VDSSQNNSFSFHPFHEQPGSGIKRCLGEQSPFPNHGTYLRPPLLESRVDTLQNIMHSMSSTVFQNPSGSMTLNEKLRITVLQNNSQQQERVSRQMLSHVPHSTDMSHCAAMRPYFDHSMGPVLFEPGHFCSTPSVCCQP
jgi:hypothetical protein